jgi:hypothetical protein
MSRTPFEEAVRQRAFALFDIEEARMRALGATDADVAEDVFGAMMAQRITEQLIAEIGVDAYRRVYKKAFADLVRAASPDQLRHLARIERAGGENDVARHLVNLADKLEKGGEE